MAPKVTSKTTRVVLQTALVLVVPLSASWAEPGFVANLGISQRLEYNDDTDLSESSDDGTRSVTGLNLGLVSVAPGQRLSLDLATSLAYNFDNPDGIENDDRSARLNYALSSRRALFDTSLSYSETDVDDSVLDDILDDTSDTVEIVTGSGTRQLLSFSTGLTLNRDGPVTLDLNQSYRKLNYVDTVDPDLLDSEETTFDATVSFRLNSATTLSTAFSQFDLDEDGVNGTQRTIRRYSLEAEHAVSSATSFTASINNTDIDTNTTATGEGGLGFGFGVSHLRPNGDVSLSISSDETVNGFRHQTQAGRSFNLPRGDLALSFGLSKTEGFSWEPLVNANLEYEVASRSTLNFELSQTATVNNSDEEILRTRMRVSYNHFINNRSSLSGSLQYAKQDIAAAGGDDEDTLRASLAYRYDVGSNWDMVTGAEYRRTNNTTSDDRTTKSLFVGVEKAISFRP